MNSLLWFKIAIIVINPLETALGALIPACLKRSKRNAERLMACAAAAAAGIFLGVGLCHMLDDATHFLEAIQPRFHGFPLALFCCCLGFSLLLLLDKIVFASHHHHHHHHHTTTTAEDDSTPLVINDHGHTHEETHALVKAVLVTVGIAVHSAVSGLATGVARDMTTLTMLAIACFAHDWSHASALVIMFDELRISRRAVVSLLVAFIATEPTCIGIGIAVTSALSDATAQIVSGVLSAVAAGVFLWIAIVELLREAFEEEPHDRVLKFCLFFFFMGGIAAVAAIA